jgi:hypothetical protein
MPNQLAAYAAADAAIAGPIIYPLSLGTNVGTIDPGASIDFAYGIAGVGFLSAAGVETPYQRGLANVLKEQINNSEEPGDQSFTNWWLRSQTDWSAGAGTLSMEPISDDKVRRSYYDSYGVDVWTPGEVKLLKATEQKLSLTATAATKSILLRVANGYYVGFEQSVFFLSSTFVSTAVTGITGGETITGFTSGNDRMYISTNLSVYGMSPGATVAVKYYTFPASDVNARVFFAKDRLILASKGAIWDDAPPLTGAPVVTLAYVNALYRKNENHLWVSAVSAPNFILLAGSSDIESVIYSLTLSVPAAGSGTLPVLNSPTVVAEFPSNETIQHMGSYLGAFLAISTNLGIRIGTMNATGVTYGARLTAPTASGPFAAFDRFLYYPTVDAGQGRTGVVRVDLSEIDTTSRAAWAKDARVPPTVVGLCDAVVVGSDGVVVFTNVQGTSVKIFSSINSLEEIGFLSSSDIRLGTTEKKYFDGLNVQLDSNWAGTLTVTAQTDDGSVGLVGSVSEASGSDIELKIDQLEGASKIALGFTLKANAALTMGPVVQSWQLRSLPSVNRQRLIKVPLLCFDQEKDSRGVPYGYQGYAITRWRALEEQSRGSWPFTYQDLKTEETYRVVLESISFSQTSPPVNASGFGGIIDLTVRVIS